VSVGDAAQREDGNEGGVASLADTGWEVQFPHRFGSALSPAHFRRQVKIRANDSISCPGLDMQKVRGTGFSEND
jgi:hypothetical protein